MDSTVGAIPVYFGTMGAEHLWLRAHAAERGPTPADYERRDTITSLTMGVGSLLAPIAVAKLLGPITPGKGKYGKALLGTAAVAVVATTVADLVARLEPADDARPPGTRRRRVRAARAARQISRIVAPVAVETGGVAITTTLASRATAAPLSKRMIVRDLSRGNAALPAATLGWDFIYYW